jgi:RHS repeat-associated protein
VKGEGNSVDFGARIFDSRVARFLSVDRFTTKTPFYTPYSYAGNKPIAAVDKDGNLEIIIHYYNEFTDLKTGKLVKIHQSSQRYIIETVEDMKGITRSAAELNVVFTDEAVETSPGQFDYQAKFNRVEEISGTGETNEETMKRITPVDYYAYKFLTGMPHEKIGFAIFAKTDANGEKITKTKRAIDITSGVIDLISAGKAGRTGGQALGVAVAWMVGDFATEETIKFAFNKLELNKDQEVVLAYYVGRLMAEKDQRTLKKVVEGVLGYSGLGTKFADYFRQNFGVNIDAPKDKKDAIENLVNKVVDKSASKKIKSVER